MNASVVVIGAGIVGAASALELLRAGFSVTIVDPGPAGGEQAASYGNGAWLSPGSVVPVSMPGLWKKVPGYIADPHGPLTIRPASLPGLTPWLLRFLHAGWNVARVEKTARALGPLLRAAPLLHAALAREAGVPHLIRQEGLLAAYPDREAFIADALGWRLRRDNRISWREFEGDAFSDLEPALSRRYRFGALIEDGGHCINPGAYVAALVKHACVQGASLVSATAIDFEASGGRLAALITDKGRISCAHAVIAAGIASLGLAKRAGNRVSMTSERGYHVMVESTGTPLRFPVIPSDGKMALTQLETGLRISGQVELASMDTPPNWRRADILLEFARSILPGLPQSGDIPHRRWMGNRPSTPDGLPVISNAALSGVFHAYGHGHVGLAAGAMTGKLVAELVSGRETSFDISPFSATRF